MKTIKQIIVIPSIIFALCSINAHCEEIKPSNTNAKISNIHVGATIVAWSRLKFNSTSSEVEQTTNAKSEAVIKREGNTIIIYY